jgi:hydrogenase maturation protease
MTGSFAVIGCGNPNRRDDGAGPRVIEMLRQRELPAGMTVLDAGTDGMSVMYHARGAVHLVIVDARVPEGSPGAIFEVPGAALEQAPRQSFNLHDFRWDHALFAGRKIYGDKFPTDVTVFLIEAGSLELGLGLTAEIETAAATVADRIVELAGAALAEVRA